jgi:hypothetical protein
MSARKKIAEDPLDATLKIKPAGVADASKGTVTGGLVSNKLNLLASGQAEGSGAGNNPLPDVGSSSGQGTESVKKGPRSFLLPDVEIVDAGLGVALDETEEAFTMDDMDAIAAGSTPQPGNVTQAASTVTRQTFGAGLSPEEQVKADLAEHAREVAKQKAKKKRAISRREAAFQESQAVDEIRDIIASVPDDRPPFEEKKGEDLSKLFTVELERELFELSKKVETETIGTPEHDKRTLIQDILRRRRQAVEPSPIQDTPDIQSSLALMPQGNSNATAAAGPAIVQAERKTQVVPSPIPDLGTSLIPGVNILPSFPTPSSNLLGRRTAVIDDIEDLVNQMDATLTEALESERKVPSTRVVGDEEDKHDLTPTGDEDESAAAAAFEAAGEVKTDLDREQKERIAGLSGKGPSEDIDEASNRPAKVSTETQTAGVLAEAQAAAQSRANANARTVSGLSDIAEEIFAGRNLDMNGDGVISAAERALAVNGLDVAERVAKSNMLLNRFKAEPGLREMVSSEIDRRREQESEFQRRTIEKKDVQLSADPRAGNQLNLVQQGIAGHIQDVNLFNVMFA